MFKPLIPALVLAVICAAIVMLQAIYATEDYCPPGEYVCPQDASVCCETAIITIQGSVNTPYGGGSIYIETHAGGP